VSNDLVKQLLSDSISAVRCACDTASYALTRSSSSEKMIERVCHDLMWGMAHASCGISESLAELARRRVEREKVQAFNA